MQSDSRHRETDSASGRRWDGLSAACRSWLSSLGGDAVTVPPDRRERLVAALAAHGLPFNAAIDHADSIVHGLTIDAFEFGISKSLGASEGLSLAEHSFADEFPDSGPLIPLTSPRDDMSVWCDATGALHLILYDLGVREPTYDLVEQMLECNALQRVVLRCRGDRFGLESNLYVGDRIATVLGLIPIPEVTGQRCRAWSSDRAIVVEGEIEQYLYGTCLCFHDDAAAIDSLGELTAEELRSFRWIKGPAAPADLARDAVLATHPLEQDAFVVYRLNGAILIGHQGPS